MAQRMQECGYLLALGLFLAALGCTQGGPTVDRVQPNLIDKEIFQGEWWVAQTAIDVDPDSNGPTWPGDMGTADLGVDKNSGRTLGRIRWVIDEKFLFAYRSFELVDGANDDGAAPDYRGQPLAAFEIQAHVHDQIAQQPDAVGIVAVNLVVAERERIDGARGTGAFAQVIHEPEDGTLVGNGDVQALAACPLELANGLLELLGRYPQQFVAHFLPGLLRE